jgi:hypothetical protein
MSTYLCLQFGCRRFDFEFDLDVAVHKRRRKKRRRIFGCQQKNEAPIVWALHGYVHIAIIKYWLKLR